MYEYSVYCMLDSTGILMLDLRSIDNRAAVLHKAGNNKLVSLIQ